MKKFLILGLVVIFPVAISYMAGCASKGTPVSTTLPPTFTKTGTPNGTFTATPTPQAVFPTIYSNGNLATVVTSTNSFSGGSSANYPTLNAADTSVGGYGGDASGYLCTWTSSEVAGMGGYSGFSLAGGSINFTGYTTCTFWAKANQTATVGFNAAEPAGDTSNVPESLTTTWTQYTINITSGARTDGQAGSISSVTTYFVCVITSAPGSTPLNVSIDRISFQGAAATSTYTNTPTNTPSNTPGGVATSTFTNTPSATPSNTPGGGPTPYVMYSNGSVFNFGSVVTNLGGVFNDGTSASPSLNATDTTAGSACCSHTMSFQASYTSLTTYTGDSIYGTPSGTTVDMTGLSTCTFYAKANQSCVVGFNAAEVSADYYSIGESLTTSWTPITINISNASRTDGWGSPDITKVVNYFVEVIVSTSYNAGVAGPYTGTFPLTVNVDQVSFQ